MELQRNSVLSDRNSFLGVIHAGVARGYTSRPRKRFAKALVNRYAIMRHAKIKAGRHLVSVGLHLTRRAETPNADADAMPVEILVGSDKPHRDVMKALCARGVLERGLRKGANVAVEVFLGASPDWWASHGWKAGTHATGELLAIMTEWKMAQLDYLRERFGDTLISAHFHPDEANPHVQALVIPVQWRVDGREKGENAGRATWRLSTEQLLKGPRHLKTLQSEYAAAMKRFGLVRGEDREAGTTWHQPLKEWQAQQAQLQRDLEEELMKQRTATEQAELDAARIRQDATDHARRVREQADREARDHQELMTLREAAARRKEDSANAAQRAIEAEHAWLAHEANRIELERREVIRLRDRLEKMLGDLDRMMTPIREYAAKWLGATGLIRQAMGAKGPAAARIVEDIDVETLDAMRKAAREGRG